MSATELPLVYLTFANSQDAHLALLKAESRDIYQTLAPLEKAGRIAIQREESAERKELFDDLVANGDRLVVFHYGGHANGQLLQLEDGAENAAGLARLLGQLRSLKLVFLNGCATQGHATLLRDAGVPAVIATSVPIGDEKAHEFSNAFYTALTNGKSIAESFDAARGFLEGKYSGSGGIGVTISRGIDLDAVEDPATAAPAMPWGLFTRDDAAADLAQWRLPDARAAWQVQLKDSRGPLRDLDGAPQVIDHRSPVRALPVLRCDRCGTASTDATATGVSCPVCGSADVVRATSSTAMGEQQVPFAVSEDQARALVRAQDPASSEPIRLKRLFVPHWVFDLDTRTTFEAERGWNRALGEVTPRFEWEPVKDAVDLPMKGYLVAAAAVPSGKDSGRRDWFWEMDRAAPLQQLDPAAAYVPVDRLVQPAFDEVVTALRTAVDAEITARVGGQEQRNISSDTRYRSVAARAVMLPYWYATIERAGQPTSVVLNGQTGALRALALPAKSDAPATRSVDAGNDMTNERTYEPGAAPATGAGDAISIFSGASTGLMIGVLLALSVSPVVGIFVGALGTGLAALLGLNDSQFSRAKGLRIGSLGIALLVGSGAGLYVRTHALLSPSLKDQRDQYIALGYSQADALRLLEGRIIGAVPAWTASVPAGATTGQTAQSLKEQRDEFVALGFSEPDALRLLEHRILGAAPPAAAAAATTAPATVAGVNMAAAGSNFFSGAANLSDCRELRMTKEREASITAPQLISNFRAFSKGWQELAAGAQKQVPAADQKPLLIIAMNAACGDDSARPGATPLMPTPAQCKAGVEASEALRPAVARINKELSLASRATALNLVGQFLCSVKP